MRISRDHKALCLGALISLGTACSAVDNGTEALPEAEGAESTTISALVVSENPDGTVQHVYDGNGNETQTIDANSNTTRKTYDGLNRLLTETNAEGQVTTHRYDDNLTDGAGIDAEIALQALPFGVGADGNAEATTNPAGETRYVVRDGVGRQVLVVDGNGHKTLF